MSRFSFSRDDDATAGNRIINRGELAIEVTSLDAASNSVTGINLSSPDNEEITVNFATVGEYADFYANRSRYTNADARQQEAAKQLAKQPTVKGLGRNGVEEGDVVQFQSVKELADGKLIARWANAVTTNKQEVDAYRRMEVMIAIPKDNASTAGKFERRVGRAYDLEGTQPASREALDRMTDAKVRRSDGSALEGYMRNSVLVSITDGVDVKSAGIDMPWGNGSPARGAGELFARPMDNWNYQPLAALAAKVGVPFENLTFVDANARNAPRDIERARDAAREIYDASERGEVGVTITPGFTGDLMLHIKQHVMKREEQAASNSRSVNLSERGFFTADVALMSTAESTDPESGEIRPAQTAFKQILPAEFLQPTGNENFIRRKASDLGDEAIRIATEKDRIAVFAPAPDFQPEIDAPKPEARQKQQTNELSTDGPGY